MRLFLVCFDNNDRGAALADSGAARWARAIAAYCIFAKASGAVLLGVALLVQVCFLCGTVAAFLWRVVVKL